MNTDVNFVPAFLRCYKTPSYWRNSPRLHYRTHKGTPVVTILRQINPLHTLQSSLCKIHFNIAVYLCLYFKSISFFQVSLPKRYKHFFSFQYVPDALPISSSFLYKRSSIWRRAQIIMICIMQFFTASLYLISLWSTGLLLHPILKHHQPLFFA